MAASQLASSLDSYMIGLQCGALIIFKQNLDVSFFNFCELEEFDIVSQFKRGTEKAQQGAKPVAELVLIDRFQSKHTLKYYAPCSSCTLCSSADVSTAA